MSIMLDESAIKNRVGDAGAILSGCAILDVAHDGRRQEFRAIGDVLDTELDKLHKLSVEGTALTGTPTGFKDLDDVTGGLQPGNLIVIAARPGMGKSALVTNIAENASIDHKKAVALFSAFLGWRAQWAAKARNGERSAKRTVTRWVGVSTKDTGVVPGWSVSVRHTTSAVR